MPGGFKLHHPNSNRKPDFSRSLQDCFSISYSVPKQHDNSHAIPPKNKTNGRKLRFKSQEQGKTTSFRVHVSSGIPKPNAKSDVRFRFNQGLVLLTPRTGNRTRSEPNAKSEIRRRFGLRDLGPGVLRAAEGHGHGRRTRDRLARSRWTSAGSDEGLRFARLSLRRFGMKMIACFFVFFRLGRCDWIWGSDWVWRKRRVKHLCFGIMDLDDPKRLNWPKGRWLEPVVLFLLFDIAGSRCPACR